jgi:hypothetical protein
MSVDPDGPQRLPTDERLAAEVGGSKFRHAKYAFCRPNKEGRRQSHSERTVAEGVILVATRPFGSASRLASMMVRNDNFLLQMGIVYLEE